MDKTYDFEIKVDSINQAKKAVLENMEGCIKKVCCDHRCESLCEDIELVLDELLFNIIDHSNNVQKRFKIVFKCDGEKVDIVVSDCRIVNVKSRSIKLVDKHKMMLNGTPHRGRGIAMIDYIMDDVKIFNVLDKQNKVRGTVVNIIKKLPKCAVLELTA